MCSLRSSGASRVGGTPCQDWSKAGNGAGESGVHLPCLFAYGAKSDHLKIPVVGLECVPQLPQDIVRDAFGDAYAWPMGEVVSPAMVGFPCTQRQRFLALNIKDIG